ncbi:glucose 1-dehydrogenase [Mycobacterium sp.]|uniref:SDR family NAD(P)-dependent oxidoreductase n=1 Tax=Mycobacterium sp. TaxID=1785 RepID=UPI0011F52716|nr:glucose 1-dehydrogenase [Mycobacterium sp.]TAM67306.1 MAG: SDR family oxidoreductase [Mycobacterium sp.]
MGSRLAGKVALITGAAGGLGHAMARAFAGEGASVAVADITGGEREVVAELGDAALAIHCDVSIEEDVAAMVQATINRFGRLDILCNNAGMDGTLVGTAEMCSDNFDRVVAVNLRGVFLGHRYSIPAMMAGGGGSIINTASIAALGGVPGAAAYSATKTGILGLTRVAAVEYAGSGVRVNAICPGLIETAMVAGVGLDHPIMKAAIAATPIGRLGRPEEVAATALFLASDESSFITGIAMPVDGGYGAI